MSDKTIDFAVRLYVNDKYGKAIGKNKYNNYVYNGTLDFARDGANYRKYLLDLSQANKQSLRSLSGDLVDWFTELVEGDSNFHVDLEDLLISRLYHYELDSHHGTRARSRGRHSHPGRILRRDPAR